MEHIQSINSLVSQLQIDYTSSLEIIKHKKDMYLETSWAPVDKLNGALGLDGGNSSIDILGDDITTVQHTTGHVLSVTWIALDHLVGWLEASVGDLSN